MTTPYVDQTDFRGRYDNGSETGATWIANENIDWEQDVDTVFRVRFQISETMGGNIAQAYELEYSTGGAYSLVTNSTPIQYAQSAEDGWTITNEDATTEQMAGTQDYVAGEYSEDAVTNSITLKSDDTELEFCLTIDSAQVADEDTITLQVYVSGGGGLSNWTNTPTITVNKAAGPQTISEGSTLGMSSSAETAEVYSRSEEDTAALSDDVDAGGVKPVSEEQTVGLSDDVITQLGGATHTVDEGSTAAFSDEVETAKITICSEEDTASLSDDPSLAAIKPVSEGSTAALSDDATAQLAGATHTISEASTIGLQTPSLSLTRETDYQLDAEDIGFSDSATAEKAGVAHSIDEGQTAGLSDVVEVATVHPWSGEDTVGFSDDPTVQLAAENTINESQTAGFSDEVTLHSTFARFLEDTAGFSEVVYAGGVKPFEAVEDTIGLSDDAIAQLAAENTIQEEQTVGLSDEVFLEEVYCRFYEDDLGFSDEVSAGNVTPREVEDTAGLSDDPTVQLAAAASEISESSTAALSDEVTINSVFGRIAEGTIGVSDSPSWAAIFRRLMESDIGLSDEATGRIAGTTWSGTDTAGLRDLVVIGNVFADVVGPEGHIYTDGAVESDVYLDGVEEAIVY